MSKRPIGAPVAPNARENPDQIAKITKASALSFGVTGQSPFSYQSHYGAFLNLTGVFFC
jgi:hypothetical protein